MARKVIVNADNVIVDGVARDQGDEVVVGSGAYASMKAAGRFDDGTLTDGGEVFSDGNVDLTPTLVVNEAGLMGAFATKTALAMRSSPDYPMREGQFEFDGPATLKCLDPGVYRIELSCNTTLGVGTVITTPGNLCLELTVSVNGESKAPAYFFYPVGTVWADGLGVALPPVFISFPQPLDVDDEIQVLATAWVNSGDIDPVLFPSFSLSLGQIGD